MKKDPIIFSEWLASITLADFINVSLMIVFTLVIIILVKRTFRGKAEI